MFSILWTIGNADTRGQITLGIIFSLNLNIIISYGHFLGVIIPHLDNRGWKDIILEINQHLCESKNKTQMQFSAHLESEIHIIIMSESFVLHIAIAGFQQYSKS